MILTFPGPKPSSKPASRKWLINGYPATVTVWTQEQWDALNPQPRDAQQVGCVWVALKVDE